MEQMIRNFSLAVILVTLVGTSSDLSFAKMPSPNNSVLNQIPEPVKSFVNSAKQIGNDLTYKSTKLKFNELSPRTIFNKIDNWFYQVTGTRLVDILKPIGNLLAWLFSTLADLIRRAVSLI